MSKCDFCGSGIADEHEHLIDIQKGKVLCACESCSVTESKEQIKRVPKRYLYLDSFNMPEEVWGVFEIPINLAFFYRSPIKGRTVSVYPSPLGAIEGKSSTIAWNELLELNPILEQIEEDVEALMVNKTMTPNEYYIAPIDECYKLIGLMRSSWKGITGGTAAYEAIKDFFANLKQKCLGAP